jgi:RNA polymerase sigma-70 factor (ECF subfamily)
MVPANEITALLSRLSSGDRTVIERLIALVYDELHRRASRFMKLERADHTLQPTALVHEVYLKLVRQRAPNFNNRVHFYAIAAQLMRRILTDHARARLSAKRGNSPDGSLYVESPFIQTDKPAGIISVDDALNELSILDKRQAKIVELRFFGGLTVEETAEILGISVRTVEREWTVARAWLYARLKRGSDNLTG